jgi:hypothetical protein
MRVENLHPSVGGQVCARVAPVDVEKMVLFRIGEERGCMLEI